MAGDLPVDLEAEQSLCGSIWAGLGIRDPESRGLLWDVSPEAFFISDHRAIWEGMRRLAEKSPDPPSEHQLVWSMGKGKPSSDLRASVLEVLSHGADSLPQPLVARVLELWQRRTAIRSANEIINAATDLAVPIEAVSEQANAAFLDAARGGSSRSQIWSATDMLPKVESSEPFRTGSAAEKLLYFGIDWLDELLVGGPGNMTILGGRPGCAKSGLGLQARNVTAQHGITAGFFSLELPRDEVDARDAAWWLSDPGRGLIYSYKKILRESYDVSPALDALRESIPAMSKSLAWAGTSGCSVGSLVAAISEAVHSYNLKLAVIDYFQYIKPERSRNDTLAAAYASNSMALKRASQDLNIHILLLSQLSRADNEKPKLTDLKETGQLEQDGVAVPLLYKDKDGHLCLTMPKHRDGETIDSRELEVHWPCLRIRAPLHQTDPGQFF